MKIFKYSVPIMNTQFSIEMPSGASILTFQMQQGLPWIWAIVHEDREKVKRNFLVRGTGWDFPPHLIVPMAFVGTIQDREFVWHLFDLGEGHGTG